MIMGAAEVRALWQRRASRCFIVHEDATMPPPPPRLASCHHQHQQQQQQQQQHSSSSSSAKSFGDSSDFSCGTKWWLKGSSGFDDEEIANSFLLQDSKFVDLTGISKEKEKEEEDYSFISKKDTPTTTPWWRSTTDQDELALLVSTRSLDHHHIQNCDLPPPQKLHKSIHCTSGERGFQTAVVNSPWKQGAWSDRFDRSSSHSSSNSTSPNSSPQSDDVINKAQLLEALRHSQSRAREAEKAAKEACAEKDRLVTVLMRQAGQILAYKQWIKLLEMESLYLQMKREEEEEEEQGQVEGMNLKKRKQRGKKKNKKMGEIGRYMMAFALGFSLIGAGLLLGWTVGWLFPF